MSELLTPEEVQAIRERATIGTWSNPQYGWQITLADAYHADVPRLLEDREALGALAQELAEALDGVKVQEVAPFVTRMTGRGRSHKALAKARAAGLLEQE